MMWEACAERFEGMGGEVLMGRRSSAATTMRDRASLDRDSRTTPTDETSSSRMAST